MLWDSRYVRSSPKAFGCGVRRGQAAKSAGHAAPRIEI